MSQPEESGGREENKMPNWMPSFAANLRKEWAILQI
jgi:hypothetical protein